MAPVVSEAQFEKIQGLIEKGISKELNWLQADQADPTA